MINLKYKEIEERVKLNISEYIGFDVRELFSQSDYITIYGGAVRDSIAGMEIHDIDILCMPQSARKLKDFLSTKGYNQIELYDRDTLNMYKGISVIEEPWTLINSSSFEPKIIQIIRPRWNNFNEKSKHYSEVEYEKIYHKLISNVDLSCCGVFLEQEYIQMTNEPKLCLKEACENAIVQCLTKTFEINRNALLYNDDRIYAREHKLTSRGWRNFGSLYDITNSDINKTKIEREHKLTKIELYFNQSEYNKVNHIWREIQPPFL